MDAFVYESLPARVMFGRGTLTKLPEEIERLGCRKALVLSTAQQSDHAQRLADAIGSLSAGVFAGAVMHTPVAVTTEALRWLSGTDADCLIALGGGSTVGLSKALALRTGTPQIAIPTTYAGSEMTPILGQTDGQGKTTIRDLRVLPETVIYDVDLTLTLPFELTVTSGINAIAHGAEALYARERNPIIFHLAEDGIRALAQALPRLQQRPGDGDARSDALYGAWACGTCLGSVGMALHHKICHVLGGSFNLPHSETHTVVLPHALAYNAAAAPDAMARLARALGVADAPAGLFDLIASLNGPTSLQALGMPADGIDTIINATLANPYWNPRGLEPAPLRQLLQNAWSGTRPTVMAR
jgi:maleylacetate reductase